LDYHAALPRGKIGITATKSCSTQADLSLAYTPGVAEPCLAIKQNKENVWKYTGKGNNVAVITDGSAVLGLGNIGAEAALPVMEGKAVLFKKFADIDAFPICLRSANGKDGHSGAGAIIEAVKMLEPAFGGINLEDIASPACFEIEERLKKSLNIPVFHDDQHGTAIISLAALLNGLELTGKKISEIKVVVNGAGAAGIACAKFYENAGVKHKNIIMCDRHGIVYHGRKMDMNSYKGYFAQDTDARSLTDAIKCADVFLGVSAGNVVSEKMVKSMNDMAMVFAMANPVPEIMPQKAKKADAYIVATGRSDFSNQVNNVLGFPGIFRGALDCNARSITEKMKVAASQALAEIAREKVPKDVGKFLSLAYRKDAKRGMFNGNNPLAADYVIPKPFDPRVVPRVAKYVAEAAMKDKVARYRIGNIGRYEKEVAKRIMLCCMIREL